MPQQLIYTSASVGLVPGRSGFCTVARSASMREALALQLEQLSYYQHHTPSGGQDRPVCAYRIIPIRGSQFHVLTRIQNASMDFTGRPNFIAHHLVFAPEELSQLPTPPVILRDWTGWKKSWTEDPQMLDDEKWSEFSDATSVPAKTWLAETKDAINGFGLLETRSKYAFLVDILKDETILTLFAESMELLEVKDRRGFRTAAWQYTFTTSMQEQDNPADFRWRCLRSDNPATPKFASPDRQQLTDVRISRECKDEESAFARIGRQPPRFVIQPLDLQIIEGSTARFQAKAEGIPNPTYQWLTVDRTNTNQPVAGEISQDFVPSNPVLGVSRYAVRASNSTGSIVSRTATLSVERKPALVQPKPAMPLHVRREKSEQETTREWQDFQSQEIHNSGRKARSLLRVVSGIGLALVALFVITFACFICMSPAHQSTFEKWLAIHFPRFRGLTNGSPSAQIADKAGVSASPQSLTTNTPLRDTNATSDQIGATISNQNHILLADPGLSSDSKLPDFWKQMDIETTNAHIESLNGNNPNVRFKLSSVAKGFATNGDSLLFVAKTTETSSFTAALYKVDFGTPQSRSGIMVRQSTNANSPFLFLGASLSLDQVFLYLRSDEYEGMLYSSPPVTLPKRAPDSPVFLKFEHTGNSFNPFFSIDNKTWLVAPRGNYAIRFKGPAHVGFAAFSGSSSDKIEAIISDVSRATTNDPQRK